MDDVLMLSRLQFAAATIFHFFFVPLTLGLTWVIAYMESKYVKTGDKTYLRMAKFWGKLFLVNFALGVVTGITLEFQFGTNWAKYSVYVGDIFGSLLAIEATAAFFLESTMMGVWIFGWNRISPKAHARVAWLIAIGSNLSAVWIIIANGWMQNPVGYVIRNGRAELDNFLEVITNPFALGIFLHMSFAALLVGGFFVMGISAYHLLRKNETEIFSRSFNIGAVVAVIGAILVAAQGHSHGNDVAKYQPEKLAAMESHWETQTNAPMYLLAIPNLNGEPGNMIEALPVPGLLSMLAFNDPNAKVVGLNDIPEDERPPVAITFFAFRTMVALGTIMPLLALFGYIKRKNITEYPRYLKLMLYAIPLPYIATEAGWIVAEVGRQPWIVYGMMKTSDAVSVLQTGQVVFSFFTMVLLYSLLGAAGAFLMVKFVKKGPEAA
ncbi:MAG: cytochrome ubiquinol oxidase subunit I [Desulfovibrio sp.]